MTVEQEQLAAVKKVLGLDDPDFLIVAFTDAAGRSHFLADALGDYEPLVNVVADVLQPDTSRRRGVFRREYEGGHE